MNPERPDISILIVSWNAKDYLKQCLLSIRDHQHQLQVETVVADNDSHDGSPEMVQSHFPEVRLVQTGDNLGFARGNNAGLEHCRGRYVFLVNSDVVLLPGCLDALTGYLDAHPQIGIAGPCIRNADHSLQVSASRFPTLASSLGWALFLDKLPLTRAFVPGPFMRPGELADTREVDILSGCFWAVRREALDEVGGLDAGFFMYGEDRDWCRRFAEAGWQVVYYTGAEAIHFGGASSANAPARFFVEMKKSDLQLFEKHYGRGARNLLAGVFFLHCAIRWAIWKGRLVFGSDREKRRALLARYGGCLRWLVTGHKPRG